MEKAHKQKLEQQQAAAAAAAAQNSEQSTSANTPGPESENTQPDKTESEDLQNDQGQANSDAEKSSSAEEDEETETESEDEEMEALYEKLKGKKVNEDGNVIDKKTGTVLGKLVEGKLKRVIGRKVRENGTLVSSKGKLIGRVEPIFPKDSEDESEEESEDESDEEEKTQQDDTTKDETAEGNPGKKPASREIKHDNTDHTKDGKAQERTIEDLDVGATSGNPDSSQNYSRYSSVDDNSPEVRKSGKVLDKDDNLVGHVDQRIAPKLEGLKVDDDGNVISNDGHIVAKADMIKSDPVEEPKEEEDQPFNPNPHIKEDSPEVKKSGKILDMNDDIVGHIDSELAAKYAGLKVDPEGNVVNNEGHIVGKADMIKPEEETVETPAEESKEDKPFNPNPHIKEDSPEVKKSGKIVDKDDNIVGHIDPELAAKYAGLKVDPEGNVVNNEGHIVGKAEMVKTEEEAPVEESKEDKPFNPNLNIKEDSPEIRKSGKIFDKDDNLVGHIDAEIAAKYAGYKVDPEGNVVNEEGNIVARAQMIQEESPEQPYNPNPMITEDSPEVKKSGKVVDSEDNVVGHVDKRVAAKLVGLKVDDDGNVVDKEGRYVGKAEMIQPEEEKEFNPNQMVDENSPEVKKSGKVLDSDDNLVGNVDKRVAHKFAGFKVDPEGNIINEEGHIVGKADMIPEEEEEPPAEQPKYPNPIVDENSPEVKRSGKVIGMDDEVVGNVDKRDAPNWVGFKVSNDGSVIDHEGNMVGKAEMITEKTEEELAQETEENEYRRIADNMSQAIQRSLDKIKPVLKQITDNIDAEEAKSPDDRNEEKLVETVKPLIEQASGILNEANGAIRGLDPTGQIAKKAQARTNERKALPEEYHLADLLAQLSGEVSSTIDRAKKKIKNMPHAKKALSPLWNILQSPLLQILSAVGLLLTGVLGLVGNILNGLGLGGIINSLLGGIGLNKVLEGFGLGEALKLGGNKKKQ